MTDVGRQTSDEVIRPLSSVVCPPATLPPRSPRRR